jgi:phosphoribosylformylglycinamidine (FGAM) synthase-like amidotransferase family enzyme
MESVGRPEIAFLVFLGFVVGFSLGDYLRIKTAKQQKLRDEQQELQEQLGKLIKEKEGCK